MKSSKTHKHAPFLTCLAGIILGLALGAASCRKTDVRKVEISVPGMTNAACATQIQNAFMTPQGTMQGIVTIVPDLDRKVVTITYDSMKLARTNLEYIIAGAGFDANDVKAKTNPAALPPK